jgi:hypothetical protein
MDNILNVRNAAIALTAAVATAAACALVFQGSSEDPAHAHSLGRKHSGDTFSLTSDGNFKIRTSEGSVIVPVTARLSPNSIILGESFAKEQTLNNKRIVSSYNLAGKLTGFTLITCVAPDKSESINSVPTAHKVEVNPNNPSQFKISGDAAFNASPNEFHNFCPKLHASESSPNPVSPPSNPIQSIPDEPPVAVRSQGRKLAAAFPSPL